MRAKRVLFDYGEQDVRLNGIRPIGHWFSLRPAVQSSAFRLSIASQKHKLKLEL